MKKMLAVLVVLALSVVIGLVLPVLVGKWLAVAILGVVLCVAVWNLIKEEVSNETS